MVAYLILGSVIAVLSALCILFYSRYTHIKFLHDRTNDINDIMIRVSEELRNFKSLDELYKQLLDDTIKLIKGAETGSILIYNKDLDLLEYKAAAGYSMENLKRVTFRKEELFIYKTTKLMAPDIVRNPRAFDSKYIDRKNYKNLQNNNALEMKVCLSSPLYINGSFFGLVNVDNSTDENAFDKNDIRLAQYICRQLEVAITNARLMNRLVEALRIDKLTGIYNKRYFDEIIEKEIFKAKSGCEPFNLVMIDMDSFKMINDTYGHKVGDEILAYFANVLKRGMGHGDVVARYAGDEFILINRDRNIEDAVNRINNIRNYLKENKHKGIDIEFSAGICQWRPGMNFDRLLTFADDDMYREKRQRKEYNHT